LESNRDPCFAARQFERDVVDLIKEVTGPIDEQFLCGELLSIEKNVEIAFVPNPAP
jgi:hypothetical protein